MTERTEDGKEPSRRMRGFERAATLVEGRIRRAGEKRGFAVARLLTHWTEIVGEEIARMARPLKVSWSHEGLGGTLVVYAPGAWAPVVSMEAERIRDRVNACYGYAAIARVRITQTAPHGFADEPARYDAGPPMREVPTEPTAEVRALTGDVADPELRAALARLAMTVRTRNTTKRGSPQ